MIRIGLGICWIVLCGDLVFAQNKLQQLASSMAPGTFALLNEDGDASGYSRDLLDCRTPTQTGVGTCFAYAQKAVYDATATKVYFEGTAHDGQPEMMEYDVAANKWTNLGTKPNAPVGHAYDSNVLDPKAKRMYVSATLTGQSVRKYDLTTNLWSQMAQPFTTLQFYQTEPSMEYFPDRDEVLWLQGGRLGGLGKYDKVADTWTVINSTLSALEVRSPIARYSGSCRCVVLLGGANDAETPTVWGRGVYQYGADGQVKRMGDLPAHIKIFVGRSAVVVDPVSGELIFLQALLSDINTFQHGFEFWKYNPVSDVWTQMSSAVVPQPTSDWWDDGDYPFAVVTVPISTYGVTLFASASATAGRSKVYIYKHGMGGGGGGGIDPTPGAPVISVGGTGVGITWPAVAGASEYQIERCQNQGCQNFSQIGVTTNTTYSDYPLTSNAVYRYRVRAVRGSAQSSYSNMTTLTMAVDWPGSGDGGGGTTPPPDSNTFTMKCGQSGVISCFGFDSASNVRNISSITAPYPLKYGGWNGTGPCASAGLGTEYQLTQGRNSATELNALAVTQHNSCYFPSIDSTVKHSGSGALKIDVPSQSDARSGGYFDTPFKGLDQAFTRVGPDNGGDVWMQFWYRTTNMVQDFGATGSNTFVKTLIFGQVPPGLDYLGSDVTLSSTFNYGQGFGTNRNGLFQSYGYDAMGNLQSTERNISGTIYLQTGTRCAYNGAGPYQYPPCVGLKDGQWQEITRELKLQPVASDFSVSGRTLTRKGTFNSGMVNRYVYITGSGFYKIASYVNADSVRLATPPPSGGSNKTVYISNYPNSVIREWVGTTLVTDVADQQMAWDLNNAGWGQFRFQPHMTNKDASITHTPGTVWYDDLIISTQPIER